MTRVEAPVLLARAKEQGKPDVYAGKRQWARYTLGMRVDVTTDPTRPSASWQVSLHNISGGGAGFWSKRELDSGSTVYLRDGTDEDSPVWLAARVMHRTVGLRGFLIGVSFDDPAPPDSDRPPERPATIEEVGPAEPPPGFRPVTRSLLANCLYATIATGTVTATITYLVVRNLPADARPLTLLAVAGGYAVLVGTTCGWLVSRRQVRFLKSLETSIREVALTASNDTQLTDAPTREFSAVRRAFLDLAARWRKWADDERVQRQKLEELTQIKSNILAIVSHDLRTPLTSILMYAQILLDELDSLAEEDQRSFLGIISDECTRLARLVDDLLEVQRLESGSARWEFRSQDLAETLRNCARVFEAMAYSKSMELAVDCPPSLPPVMADSDKISQVLSNLLSNAIKYTQEGGKVELAAEARGNDLVFRVADNGPGIPRDKWDQIFDRFSQLSDPNNGEIAGVGLGLNIVKKIVERHGGTVWVDSQVGEGTEFFVLLAARAEGVPLEAESWLAVPAGCVAICDSDPELAARIAQTLRLKNFDVRIAHSGYRLLSLLGQGDVDVVVTDVLLPDMNAAELLNALHNVARCSFRTIIHSYEGDAQEFRRRGVDIFLERPVSKGDLVRAVRAVMQKRSAAGRSVVLVNGYAVDLPRLQQLVTDGGHIPVIAASVKEAVTLANDYRADIVVVSSDALVAEAAEFKRLRTPANKDTRVVVLCESMRKRERLLEAEPGVTVVPYRAGKERAVMDAIMASVDALPVEMGT